MGSHVRIVRLQHEHWRRPQQQGLDYTAQITSTISHPFGVPGRELGYCVHHRAPGRVGSTTFIASRHRAFSFLELLLRAIDSWRSWRRRWLGHYVVLPAISFSPPESRRVRACAVRPSIWLPPFATDLARCHGQQHFRRRHPSRQDHRLLRAAKEALRCSRCSLAR